MERRKSQKRPKELNQLAKHITDVATGEVAEEENKKNPHAVEMGKLGGKKRSEKLSKPRKKEIALQAALKRWRKK